MAKEDGNQQEGEELLQLNRSRSTSPDSDIVAFPAAQTQPPYLGPRRQSSFAQPRSNGTPRTQNRVRFDVADSVRSASVHEDEEEPDGWVDEEDYMSTNGHAHRYGGRRDMSGQQRAPLLTNIEAPTVTVAESDFNPEDLLESSRPTSGMKSAFMNMANSIMYVDTGRAGTFRD